MNDQGRSSRDPKRGTRDVIQTDTVCIVHGVGCRPTGKRRSHPGWALDHQEDPLRKKRHRMIEGKSEMSSICHILHGRTSQSQIG